MNVTELLETLIGADEKFKNLYQWHEAEIMNQLRAEQRTQITETPKQLEAEIIKGQIEVLQCVVLDTATPKEAGTKAQHKLVELEALLKEKL